MLKLNKKQRVNKSRALFLMLITIVMIGLNSISNFKIVKADDANPTTANFFVQPYFDNNASAGADYKNHNDVLWYNNVKPGSTVRTTVLITNQSKKERSFRISAYTGSTNDSGGITYSVLKPTMDSSQKIDFRSLFPNNDVIVKNPSSDVNNGQVAVSLVAKIPNKEFKGTILGGINVKAYDPTEKQSKKQQSLVNKFSYVIPVIFNINCSYEHNEFTGKDTLRLGNVVPQVEMIGRNAQANMQVSVSNTKPGIISNFRTHTVITKKDNSKMRTVADTESNQMAPNSVWKYPVKWGDQAIQSGTYHITMKIRVDGDTPVPDKTSVNKKYDYKMEKDFTITGAQADQLNRQMGIKPNYLWLWILLGVLAVLLIILVVWYFARRTKKNNSV
ncbi:DUF3324 domain-containing protein [Xylocopilactobacillus apis]|uniref:Cell surface protein n=1 Tax=Xylocopilactobacillus apis TaxID=2932183 RepID=A0AAU9CTI4_9LACO|nr:DUF3324 domain-containing protein [Xylocopilactobacillus apis]BDR57329.1 cell surface protein [Xylocopilactobacillus apis]